MSYGHGFTMPSSFHCEAPNGVSFGMHSPDVFRPPMPRAGSSFLSQANSSYYSIPTTNNTAGSAVKRKRYGRFTDQYSATAGATPTEVADDPLDSADLPDSSYGSRFTTTAGAQKSNGREFRYTLGGQIGTPIDALHRELGDETMDDSVHSDVNYRTSLGPQATLTDLAQQDRKAGWSRSALSTLGGVVGKVWQFCKSGAFKGFYAGGGTGFIVNTSIHCPSSGQAWCSGQDLSRLVDDDHRSPSPHPSPHPSDIEYTHAQTSYFYGRDTPESTPPPAPKRRQLLEHQQVYENELGKNWVVVGDEEDGAGQINSRSSSRRPSLASRAGPASSPYYSSRPSLSHRRISKPVSRLGAPSLASSRRPSSRGVSHAGSTSLSHREPASFASSRPTLNSNGGGHPATPSRIPSRIPIPSPCGSSSYACSPSGFSPSKASRPSSSRNPNETRPRSSTGSTTAASHRRTRSSAAATHVSAISTSSGSSSAMSNHSSSAATTRTSISSTAAGTTTRSPARLDKEAQSMVSRRLREEQETDMRINDFNARLKEMIRQGKEALGTTVEVEGEGEGQGDEGGGDGWEDE